MRNYLKGTNLKDMALAGAIGLAGLLGSVENASAQSAFKIEPYPENYHTLADLPEDARTLIADTNNDGISETYFAFKKLRVRSMEALDQTLIYQLHNAGTLEKLMSITNADPNSIRFEDLFSRRSDDFKNAAYQEIINTPDGYVDLIFEIPAESEGAQSTLTFGYLNESREKTDAFLAPRTVGQLATQNEEPGNEGIKYAVFGVLTLAGVGAIGTYLRDLKNRSKEE